MNKILKRIFAVILVISALITTVFSASAASGVTFNDGERHVICEELSESALSYYKNYSYDTLKNKSQSELLSSLRTLMTTTHKYKAVYSDSRDRANKTDSMNNDGKISLLYTSVLVTRSDFGGPAGTWNREHVWPKSLGGFNQDGAGADLHHIRPSDATVNAARGDKKYGNVTGGSDVKGSSLVNGMVSGESKGSYFEPLDNVKGDVARICLYVYVRYGSEYSKCSNITNVFESVDVLLEWCALDPVDEWEMGRNDTVENIQGNRNVFIDYPEYAFLLFGKEVPAEMTTPSGKADSDGSGNTPPTVDGDTPPTVGGDTPPSADGSCAHKFTPWEDIGQEQMMRHCTICKEYEFAPIDYDVLNSADNCTHEFDIWEDMSDGNMMRMCKKCSKMEIAPLDPTLTAPTPQAPGNTERPALILPIIIGSSVIIVGIGITVFFVWKRKQ